MKIMFVLAVVAILALAGCGDADKEDDEQLYSGEVDTKIAGPLPVPTVEDLANASYPTISGHGILWKPIADSGGNLVVLLNRSWGKPTVKIKNRRNQVLAVGKFVYYSNPNRATYRFAKPGASFGSCYLIVGTQIFYVPNGARRYE